jgi:hypothetical protein
LVGAAWKILDLLVESALDEAGIKANYTGRWTTSARVAHAKAASWRPRPLGVDAWAALTRTYVETVELRHSLVHRRAYTDVGNSLIGTNHAGAPVRSLTAIEQEAFVRSALRAAELVTVENPDDRVEADLIRQLGALSGVHGQQLPAVRLLDSLPEITVVVDPETGESHRYVLDVPALWARQRFRARPTPISSSGSGVGPVRRPGVGLKTLRTTS